jgi:hypothetical protein
MKTGMFERLNMRGEPIISLILAIPITDFDHLYFILRRDERSVEARASGLLTSRPLLPCTPGRSSTVPSSSGLQGDAAPAARP